MRQEWVGKRQAVRTSVQLRAQMRFGGGQQPVDCVVTDISQTGARILIPDDGPYSSDFDLYIPARSETKWARVRWREKRLIGVEFLKFRQDDRDGLDASVLDRLMRLEDRVSQALESASRSDGEGAASARRPDDPPGERPPRPVDDERLAALEARLTQMESNDRGAASEKRLARLEQHVGELSTAETASLTAPQSRPQPELDDILVRLAEHARRLQAVEHEIVGLARAADEGSSQLRELVGEVSLKLDHVETSRSERPNRQQEEADDALRSRLEAVETSAAELRASLRMLILLMAQRIQRAREAG